MNLTEKELGVLTNINSFNQADHKCSYQSLTNDFGTITINKLLMEDNLLTQDDDYNITLSNKGLTLLNEYEKISIENIN
jgi:predicted transcriptional regulator